MRIVINVTSGSLMEIRWKQSSKLQTNYFSFNSEKHTNSKHFVSCCFRLFVISRSKAPHPHPFVLLNVQIFPQRNNFLTITTAETTSALILYSLYYSTWGCQCRCFLFAKRARREKPAANVDKENKKQTDLIWVLRYLMFVFGFRCILSKAKEHMQ